MKFNVMSFCVKSRCFEIFLCLYRTYDECEYFPGPSLNVILGPNGEICTALL